MQDVQNIPNPDVNSTEREDEFGNHSDIERENESNRTNNVEDVPLPPDEPRPPSIEEPPETEKPAIDEGRRSPKQIV